MEDKDLTLGYRAAFKAACMEVARLTRENWQLKGALGYPVPGDIPPGPFKCGLCEAREIRLQNAYEQAQG